MDTSQHVLIITSEEEAVNDLIKNGVLTRCRDLFHTTYHKFLADHKVEFSTKSDGSLVSSLEIEIEKVIGAYLKQATPWAGFVSEEGLTIETQQPDSEFKWYLDPIDGTLSFKNQIETFAFVLTLVSHQEAVASVIDFPALGKTYKVYKGQGATMNDKPISVLKKATPHSIFAVSDNYTFGMTDRVGILDAIHKTPFVVRTYTDIYGYSLVAEGKCAGKFDAAGALWDLWPGYLLIKEAGGDCLFFPVENPIADLTGSLLVGSTETIKYIKDHLQNHKQLPEFTTSLPVSLEVE